VFVNASNLTINTATFAVTGVGGGNSVTISTNSTHTNTVLISNYLTVRGNTTFTNAVSFSNSVTVTGAVNMANTQKFITSGSALIAESGANTVTVSTATANVIDSFNGSTYRGGKYVISIKDNATGDYQMTEILLMHSDSAVYTTEYATLKSGSSLAVFSANATGSPGTVRLWATPSVANSTYKIVRTLTAV
jgi:hypothetical protein